MKGKKSTAIFMAMVMVSQVLGFSGITQVVHAAGASFEKTEENTGLGTNGIRNPQGIGQWDYVWFGRFMGEDAVRYRVLSKDTQAYNNETQPKSDRRTMFLDCDYALISMVAGPYTGYDWKTSTAKTYLNSKDFLGDKSFTEAEEKAIAPSYRSKDASDKDNEALKGGDPAEYTQNFAALDGEKVFLLDAREAVKTEYGYPHDTNKTASRIKNFIHPGLSSRPDWWLRNEMGDRDVPCYVEGNDAPQYETYPGRIGSTSADTPGKYYSPAFNVDLSSVIFSTSLGKTESGDKEYKLTLKDDKIVANIDGKATMAGDSVTIPIAIVGDHAKAVDRVSVVVTNKAWSSTSGWDANDEILQYTPLKLDSTSPFYATQGTFTLDSEEIQGVWGKDYHVYLIAEDLADMADDFPDQYKSDYSSAPLEVSLAGDPDDPEGTMRLNTNKLVLKKKTSRTITATFTNNDVIKSAVATGKSGIISSVTHTDKTITVKAGKKIGDAVLTVTSGNGIVKTVDIKVQNGKVVTKSLTVSKASVKLYTNGIAKLVKVKASPDVVSTLQKITLTVIGSTKVDATYDPDTGYIRLLGLKPGNATVRVKAGGKTKRILVRVKNHDLVLNTTDLTIQTNHEKAVTAKLYNDSIIKVRNGDASKKLIKSVTFDENNIYITAGKSVGSSYVTVLTKSGILKKIKVTTQKGAVVTKTITVSPTTVNLSLSGNIYKKKVTLPVKVAPNKASTDQPVTVTLKGKSDQYVSALYNENNKKLTIAAKGRGSAVITVKAGKKKVNIKVKVRK